MSHSHRGRARVLVSAVCIAVVVTAVAAAASERATGPAATTHSLRAQARPAAATPAQRPAPTPPAVARRTGRPTLARAVAYAHVHHVRVGIAVADLTTKRVYAAGDPGSFGTGSVVKVLVAAKMMLTGAMTGIDAKRAYEMIIGSNDADGTALWTANGGPDIVTWLNHHYKRDIGTPNTRAEFWGNTHTTARGMARFYLAVSADPAVWPWLRNAMAHTKRIADDGTDQYFGIPDAGGGSIVKQGWGTSSADDGYSRDATVNSTGIVTVRGREYAVVLLTEGDGNDAEADARGLVHAQAALITQIAVRVLAAVRTWAP